MVCSGRVVYEMGSGRQLNMKAATPFEDEYRQVESRDVRNFLRYIFEMKDERFHSIEEV